MQLKQALRSVTKKETRDAGDGSRDTVQALIVSVERKRRFQAPSVMLPISRLLEPTMRI